MLTLFGVPLWAALLLICLNLFMAASWHQYLRHNEDPLWRAILVSWSIALLMYCCQGREIRVGWPSLSPAHLKLFQESVTFAVFAVFMATYFKPAFPLKFNRSVSLVFLLTSVIFTIRRF